MTVERDAAGNTWATAPGDAERFVIVGGHLDSVPNGGWLDGALNVVAGLEVLRALAPEERPFTLKLVDWADEEGARFGRSLLGSSAARGHARPRGACAGSPTATAPRCRTRSPPTTSTSTRCATSGAALEGALAYLELHIEQGPVLEQLDMPLGAVLGTFGVQRHKVRLHRRARPRRREPDAPAPATPSSPPPAARWRGATTPRARDDVRATTGVVKVTPGIVTAFNGTCEVSLDQRSLDAGVLAEMLADGQGGVGADRRRGGLQVAWEQIWEIEPILFDAGADRPRRRGDPGGRRDERAAAERARCTTPRRWPASCRP